MPRTIDFILNTKAVIALGISLPAIAGCSSQPARVYQADVDPVDAAAQIMANFDADGSGSLAPEELTKLACVNRRFSAYDASGDGVIDSAELSTELAEEVFNPSRAMMQCAATVKNKGRAVPQATVKFVPLTCFAEALPTATGATGADGVAVMDLAPGDLPAGAPPNVHLIRPGLYRVEVTHPSLSIPAQYNVESTLTAEVSAASLANGPASVELDF